MRHSHALSVPCTLNLIPRVLINSASMRCVSRRTSLQVLNESEMRSNAKKVRAWRRCQANFAPNSREEFLRKSGAPREQRLRALGQRALRMLKKKAEVDRVGNAFRSEKARVRRRDHAKVAPKSRKRIAKFPKVFGAARAQKVACTRPSCAETRMTASKLFTKS